MKISDADSVRPDTSPHTSDRFATVLWKAQIGSPNPRVVARCYAFARSAAGLVTLIGLFGLAISALALMFPLQPTWWDAWIPARPLVGVLALVMAALIRGMVRVDQNQAPKLEKSLLYCGAVLLVFVGGVICAEYAAGTEFGLWPSFWLRPAAVGSRWAARLSLGVALGILSFGAAALALLRATPVCVVTGQALAHVVGFIAFVGAVGFLFGAHEALAQTLPWSEMPPVATVVLLLATLGLVCARPRVGIMSLFTADSAGGVLLRRLLLPSAAVPVGLGVLVSLAERRRWLPLEFGEVLVVVLLVLLAGVHLWQVGWLLHLRDAEFRRQDAELGRRLHILESSLNEIYVFDAATLRFEYVNAAARRNLGYPQERFCELTPLDLQPDFTPERFAALLEPLRTGARDRQVFETRHRRADGTWYPVEEHLELIRNTGRSVFLVVARDLTEERAVAARLRESQAELERAQVVAHIGSWALDLAANRLHWSEETYRIFGVPPGRPLTYEEFLERVHPEDRARLDAAWQAALRGAPYRIEHRIVVDGRVRWVEERAELEFDASGRPVRGVGTVQDITERRELEEQLRQAQKLEVVGLLAGGVAHDFNNLLTIIMLNSGFVAGEPDLPPSVRRANREIASAAERAAALTRQLLLFSRRQPLQPRVLDLNDVVRDLSKMLARLLRADIALELNLSEQPLQLHADPIELEQVLLNLVVNAADAMPAGGRVTICTGERIGPSPSAPASKDGSPKACAPQRWVWLQVRDTGAGIPPEILPRIFEPFFTTKEPGKGTGLGLATVQSIVKQRGGEIAVTSEVGKGSCFDIFLPAHIAATESSVRATLSERSRSQGETVLLVEDEVAVRNLAAQILRGAGYRVLSAANAQEALCIWRAQAGSIDLLASDLVMPGQQKGNELAELLQREKPGLPVLLLSGYNPETIPGAQTLRREVHFLQKPFTPEQLLHAVSEALGRSQAAA